LSLGAGAGFWYEKDGFSVSVNYVSPEAAAEASNFGIFNGETITAQIGYAAENWGAAFAYAYSELFFAPSNSITLAGYWQPSDAGWAPSISAGFGYGDIANVDAWSWMVGLQWSDVAIKGNDLGFAIGSAGSTNAGLVGTGGIWFDSGTGASGSNTLAAELWYKFQATDNISVTPAIFWIENNGGFSDTWGGLVKTTFKF
jgi:hypothetical protein